MNRKNFLKTLFSGAVVVVAAPLAGQVSKGITGKMIRGSVATLKPMVGKINELAAEQYVIPNAGKIDLSLVHDEDSLEKAQGFYEWMQEVVWEGLS